MNPRERSLAGEILRFHESHREFRAATRSSLRVPTITHEQAISRETSSMVCESDLLASAWPVHTLLLDKLRGNAFAPRR